MVKKNGKVIRKAALLFFTLGLVGCNNYELNNNDSNFKTVKENQENTIRKFLIKSLPNPDAVIFRNQRGACGEVNYIENRNIYTGFKRFIFVDQDIILIEGFTDPENFQLAWNNTCKHRWS